MAMLLLGLLTFLTSTRALWTAERTLEPHLDAESFLEEASMLRGWHKIDLPRAGQYKFMSKSKGATFGQEPSAHSVIAVITARDLYIGCHSYEDYLSPDFETLFLFDNDYANLWGFPNFVEGLSKNETLGAYLFVGNKAIGENSARKIGLEYIQTVTSAKPDFMFSVNCDIHPIPKGHRNYQSFQEITNTLARTFALENALREPSEDLHVPTSFAVRDGNILTDDRDPIFAMNTILWLGFNGNYNDLFSAVWHGADHFSWYKQSFLKKEPKPLILVQNNQSWLTEVDYFVESHALIFDVKKMASIADDYFTWDSMPSETHGIGLVAAKHGWVVRRHNEIHMHFDQAPESEDLENKKYAPIHEVNKMNKMKLLNFELAADRRNPAEGWRIYRAYRMKHAVMMPDYYGGGFLSFIWRNHHIPTVLQDIDVHDEYARRWIKSAMQMAGYIKINKTHFQAEGAYPSTLQLGKFVSETGRKNYPNSNFFLNFYDGHFKTKISSSDPTKNPVDSNYPVRKRSIELPIHNNSRLSVTSSPLPQRGTFGFEYFHVTQEQCEQHVLFKDDVHYEDQWHHPSHESLLMVATDPKTYIESVSMLCHGCD
eukprot:CAMPEP_0184500772 /NCGR_PEP_ID=MMETSP0113_2-20130426/45788_1 /TAXON_ID=91329 /ORGANISM="Norrisiella sphaerica, Strain BC52" /LENGTH=597 /DNA_ID=CAMNT_0026889287 /DNA_START=166 /DNA_END=1959 /DNA_ORIENTATION=-